MKDLGKHNLSYAVWAQAETLPEIPRFDCAARFTYLQEALDYVQYAVKRGSEVILTGPYNMVSRYPKS